MSISSLFKTTLLLAFVATAYTLSYGASLCYYESLLTNLTLSPFSKAGTPLIGQEAHLKASPR